MLKLFRPKDDVADFWRWFEANSKKVKTGVERQDHAFLIKTLGDKLSKVHPGIVHEIGKPDEDTIELILSADGIKAVAPAVRALARAAPHLPGFLITAFRPRWPTPGLEILNRQVTGEDIRYRSIFDGEKLNLVVFLNGDFTERERLMIGFLMLDQALGEYDVMTGVGEVSFEPGAPFDAKPLSDLATEFDALKGARAH
jgi:hypothetical protein